jgi:hypothetical protein
MSTTLAAEPPVIDVERFRGPWPGVLVEMKDFVDLWFLASKHRARGVRIFISRPLVPQAALQPHMRLFKASLGTIPGCAIELKGTDEPQHRIEIEHRRGTS